MKCGVVFWQRSYSVHISGLTKRHTPVQVFAHVLLSLSLSCIASMVRSECVSTEDRTWGWYMQEVEFCLSGGSGGEVGRGGESAVAVKTLR